MTITVVAVVAMMPVMVMRVLVAMMPVVVMPSMGTAMMVVPMMGVMVFMVRMVAVALGVGLSHTGCAERQDGCKRHDDGTAQNPTKDTWH